MVDHNQHIVKAICSHASVSRSQDQLYATVWVEHEWLKGRSHLWLNLCSSTHDAALTKIFHILANSFLPEFVQRFSKSASNSYVTSCRTFVHACDQSHSELRVPRNTKAIEAPKTSSYVFYPVVFPPLTLVPVKRVLGVPFDKIEISELIAQMQRVNRH
jgi:hypothetical protein